MAAPTQTADDKSGFSDYFHETTEGLIGHKIGSIVFFVGAGTPDGEVTAPKGSIFVDNSGGGIYRNTDGSTTWAAFN
jgi:hypothetical protein